MSDHLHACFVLLIIHLSFMFKLIMYTKDNEHVIRILTMLFNLKFLQIIRQYC